MRRTIRFETADIMPPREAVLGHQGIPPEAGVPERIEPLLEEAEALFAEHARTVGILDELEGAEFGAVFEGEGENAEDAVVGDIFPRAAHLALFALTVGREISTQIEVLFARNRFALGSMLDSVASQAADRAAEVIESTYYDDLVSRDLAAPDQVVLGYSPGYCGWHITGQIKLFERLAPEEIGITLNESCLMTPLKSVSGVVIAGPRQIHLFDIGFSYCARCGHRSCLPRMERLRAAGAAGT